MNRFTRIESCRWFPMSACGGMDAVALEDRVLLSATPMVMPEIVEPDAMTTESPADFTSDSTIMPDVDAAIPDAVSASMAAENSSIEIAFIDASVAEPELIVAELQSKVGPGKTLEVFLLDEDLDGVEQITEILAGVENADAIHIFSHGKSGEIKLGNAWLRSGNLSAYASEFNDWANSLTSEADILIYGCDVASSEEGELLMEGLAWLTGADVAASTDQTGNSQLGGNWSLEYEVGTIESNLNWSESFQQQWNHLLAASAYDSFGTTGNLNGSSNGSGWSDSWSGFGSSLQFTNINLSDPSGNLASSGGAVSYEQSFAFISNMLTRHTSISHGADGTTTWISFVIRPDDIGANGFMGVSFGDSGSDLAFVGYVGNQIVLEKFGGTGREVVSGISAQSGTSIYFAIRIDSASGNDTITLFVNPTPGLSAPVTSFSSSKNNLNLGNWNGISILAGRGTAENHAVFDELRIGNSFFDIAPNSGPVANQAPFITSNGGASSASITVAENSTYVTTVTANDLNMPVPTFVYSIIGGDDQGLFTIDSSTGVLSFISAPNFEGTLDFDNDDDYEVEVQVTDGSLIDSQSLTITISNVNEAPIGTADSYTTNEDTSLSPSALTGVLANDSDPDGNSLSVTLVSGPANAQSFSLQNDGRFTYLPVANFNGTDSFTYQLTDGSLNTGPITVSIQVIAQLDVPEITSNGGGNSASVSVAESTSAVTQVIAEDNDGDAISYSISGGDDAVFFVIHATTGALTFIIPPDFENPLDVGGNNSYVVTVQAQGGMQSDSQTLTITVTNVNESPTGFNDSYVVNEDSNLNPGLAGGVLANDIDPDGNTLTAVLLSGPTHAQSFNLHADGRFNYAPVTNYVGADSFTYQVTDGSFTSGPITVSIQVLAQPDAPVITSNGGGSTATISILESTSLVTQVIALDADGDSIAYSIVGGDDSSRFFIHASTGFLSWVVPPVFDAPDDLDGDNVYVVRVRAFDGMAFDEQELSITVTPLPLPPNRAPVALGDAFSLLEDQSVTIPAMGLLSNDADPDGDALSASLVDSTSHGILVLRPNGSFTYTPHANYSGVDSFSYRSFDGQYYSQMVIVSLIIQSVNDAPVATADSYQTVAGVELVVGTSGLLENDVDIDGDHLTAMIDGLPTHGNVILNADGSFRYVPHFDYVGLDQFTYRVIDGHGAFHTGIVTFSVELISGNLLVPPTEATMESSSSKESSTSSSPPAVAESAVSENVDANPSEPLLTGIVQNPIVEPSSMAMAASKAETRAVVSSTGMSGEMNKEVGARAFVEYVSLSSSRLQMAQRVVRSALADELSSSATRFMLAYDESLLWQDLSAMNRELSEKFESQFMEVGSAASATGAFTIGYVLWTLRSGWLVTTMLAQMPAWGFVNPLIVLDSLNEDELDENPSEENESLETMLESGNQNWSSGESIQSDSGHEFNVQPTLPVEYHQTATEAESISL